MTKSLFIIISIFILVVCVNIDIIESNTLPAVDILKKAESLNPGRDQISKLTYIIQNKNGTERKVVMRRYWKNYGGKDGLVAKILLFHEYPPEQEGTIFMVWSYHPSAGKEDAQWLYIPILGKAHKIENTRKEFEMSDLTSSDMSPRDIDWDTHRLIGITPASEKTRYYIIESTPKKIDPKFNYSKIIKWISLDQSLNERIDYYDLKGELLKKQFIKWEKIGDVWLWRRVLVTNLQTGSKTRIEISDIAVNTNLSDELFTVDTMNKGLKAMAMIKK